MNPNNRPWRWIRSLWHRGEVKREIDAELRFHLEQRTADNLATGMSPADAAREARKRFGNLQGVREEWRELRGASFAETAWQDVRFAVRMLLKNRGCTAVAAFTLLSPWSTVSGAQRLESFDQDPGWHGHNHRSVKPETVRQDFGWSGDTAHAGGETGEIGGLIQPAAEPAYFARTLPARTLDDTLNASGRLFVERGAGHTLIGFFNAATLNEWRTPNTIALRIHQRGDVFHCHLEHCTRLWRAGAGIIGQYDKVRDRMNAKELPAGQAYHWSITYDPQANGGRGRVTATLNGDTASDELSADHKTDGAEFNRFGLLNVMKQWDGGGKLWLDDVTINGEREDFSRDPGWDASGNRCLYETLNVRPRFDFGFSPTQHAGGKTSGELGGLFFRGDCRYAERLAAYGDRLEPLTLRQPLRASGKVCLRRGVSDSTSLIGFHHATHSLQVNPSQQFATPRDFLGIAIEGPSSEGFYFYPVFRNHADGTRDGAGANPPRIYPDGRTHDWTLEYNPAAADGNGLITVTLDGRTVSVALASGDRELGAQFDRFGLVTPWIDGNGQHIYLDDLSYTCRQE